MEHGEGKELLMIQSIQHHLLNKVNAVSLVFIDDVTAGGRSRINSEGVQGYTLIQPNPAKLITQRFLVQMDDIPKHTAEATQVCQSKNIYIIRVNHLISGHYCML